MEAWKGVQEDTQRAEAKRERMRNHTIALTLQALALGLGVIFGTARLAEIGNALLYVMRNLKLYITFFFVYVFLTIELWMKTAVRCIMADHFDISFLIWMGCVIIGLMSVPEPNTTDNFFNTLRRKLVRHRHIKYIANS